MSSDTPRAAVLRLMGVLERSLRALTADQSMPFHKQVEVHRGKFSDIAGITDARRLRNALAHGENVSDVLAEEAETVLRQALTEILPHCPERMRSAIHAATLSAPEVITSKARPADAKAAPSHARSEPPVPLDVLKPSQDNSASAGLPVCDWVYFASPSEAGREKTKAVVSDLGMLIRSVYENGENRDKPKPIPNVKHIRQGHTILLVYGGKGEPYRAMFACKVVVPPRPVPHFEQAFSFADVSQVGRLQEAGYKPDPHLKKFTGISVKVSPVTGSLQTPPRGNTIRTWEQVFGALPSGPQKA